jgi:hypothetical protein
MANKAQRTAAPLDSRPVPPSLRIYGGTSRENWLATVAADRAFPAVAELGRWGKEPLFPSSRFPAIVVRIVERASNLYE